MPAQMTKKNKAIRLLHYLILLWQPFIKFIMPKTNRKKAFVSQIG
jgi:hypothetical protein